MRKYRQAKATGQQCWLIPIVLSTTTIAWIAFVLAACNSPQPAQNDKFCIFAAVVDQEIQKLDKAKREAPVLHKDNLTQGRSVPRCIVSFRPPETELDLDNDYEPHLTNEEYTAVVVGAASRMNDTMPDNLTEEVVLASLVYVEGTHVGYAFAVANDTRPSLDGYTVELSSPESKHQPMRLNSGLTSRATRSPSRPSNTAVPTRAPSSSSSRTASPATTVTQSRVVTPAPTTPRPTVGTGAPMRTTTTKR